MDGKIFLVTLHETNIVLEKYEQIHLIDDLPINNGGCSKAMLVLSEGKFSCVFVCSGPQVSVPYSSIIFCELKHVLNKWLQITQYDCTL